MLKAPTFLCVLAAGLIALPSTAHAQQVDKLAWLTFSGPIHVPGVSLAAGTYGFRLADESTSRKVIQVLSHDGKTMYAMFHTMPDWRATVTDDPVVSFKEAPAGVPPAVRTLFYGGESLGYAFVYPPARIAPAVVAPAPAFAPVEEEVAVEAEPAPAAVARAPAVEPTPEAPVAVTEPAPATETAPTAAAPELPGTASELPFVLLTGVSALGLGLGVRRFRMWR